MTDENHTVSAFINAGIAAAAGRLLLMWDLPHRNLTIAIIIQTLLWEIPVTIGIAILGYAIVEMMNIEGPKAIAFIAIFARGGPAVITLVVNRFFPAFADLLVIKTEIKPQRKDTDTDGRPTR
jgi:hypothetical protein